MIKVSAIALAAGRGLRLNSKVPKVLARIDSKPVIIYSLEKLSRHPAIKEIILVVNSSNRSAVVRALKRYRIGKIEKIVLGGKERRDSVFNGLEAVDPQADLILIHDAARPFIDENIFTGLIKEAADSGAAISGVKVKATIKKVKSQKSKVTSFIVERTINRNNLWEIQTPQVFRRDLILEAYRRFRSAPATDDAMLVEKMGEKVSIVPGSYFNIKITTPEDLVIAKAIAKHGL